MRLQFFRLLGSNSGPNRTRRFRRFSPDTKCLHTLWIDTRTVYHHRPRAGCNVQQGKHSKAITWRRSKSQQHRVVSHISVHLCFIIQYASKEFGTCPLVQCAGQPVLPCGLKDEMGADTVKIFCPKCQCVYHPPPVRSRHHGGAGAAGVDGAAFGTTFPHLFLMTFSNLVPDPLPKDSAYIPRVFGFRVHMSARQRASGGSNTSSSSSASATRQQLQQRESNNADNNRRSGGRRAIGGTTSNAKQGDEESSSKKSKSGKRKNDNESGSNTSKKANGDKRRRKVEN